MCECIFCHYWHFFRTNYRFQICVWDSCHDLSQKSMDFDDAAVVTVGENAHRIILWGMTKTQAVSKIKNLDLRGESGHLWWKKFLKVFLYLVIMMKNNTLAIYSVQSKLWKIKKK